MNAPTTRPELPPVRQFPDDPFEVLRQLHLIEDDGAPLESPLHRAAIQLLIEVVSWIFRGRDDFYVGGNMFIYFNVQQARNLDYRGPDFFFVKDSSLQPYRPYWAVWDEGGRMPTVIVELTSPSTEREDRITKRNIYERIFRTSEYFLYNFDTGRVEGWRLDLQRGYQTIEPNERGWLWSEEFNAWLGCWHGLYTHNVGNWPRLYDREGILVPTQEELRIVASQQAEAERQRAEAERQRAEAAVQRAETAEAELARLRALLAQRTANGDATE